MPLVVELDNRLHDCIAALFQNQDETIMSVSDIATRLPGLPGTAKVRASTVFLWPYAVSRRGGDRRRASFGFTAFPWSTHATFVRHRAEYLHHGPWHTPNLGRFTP
jgi:hypothetical protein